MSTNRNLNQFKNALILHISDTFYEKPHNNFKRYIILSLNFNFFLLVLYFRCVEIIIFNKRLV